jgi:transcriptional regulator with XRE-family HTH domain
MKHHNVAQFSSASRHPASAALIALREALGMSQQRLAVEILHVSISTVGRWESFEPPTGETLLRLADIARSNGLDGIANVFAKVYMASWLPALGDSAGVLIDTGEPDAYIAIKLRRPSELKIANRFLATVYRLRNRGQKTTRRVA